MSGYFSTASLVCFPCRKRRSLERGDVSNPPPHLCPECAGPMVNIGTKLQVPPHGDEKGWNRFYDQVTAPGYTTDISDLDPQKGCWEQALDDVSAQEDYGRLREMQGS